MSVRIISTSSTEPTHLPGRDLQWLATRETLGADKISVAIMTCPARSVVRPLHCHKDIEEVLLVLEGEGEAWVDGERGFFKKGDAVLFPVGSRHQVRNTGEGPLIAAAVFSPPTSPDSYVTYEEDPLTKAP